MKKTERFRKTAATILLAVMIVNMLPLPIRAEEEYELVEIGTPADFMEFMNHCKTDGWSIGKEVVLTSDLDISNLPFDGIAYFNGKFRGCGHTITCMKMEPRGSHYGFFRYIGSLGIVRDLNVRGNIDPMGSAAEIGGIAGVNQGMIIHCTFAGNARGKEAVGGIVGYNAETGIVMNCENYAVILATNYTGGIAGKNQGLITQCKNHGNVNIKELDTSIDLGGVNIGTFNLARNVVNRNNMGGIAGMSSGIISDCVNSAVIGYEHTGYNVGGIAGSQSGQIFNCVNEGSVYGRKDVGGIVGQAVPFTQAVYFSDQLDRAQDRIAGLNNTLNGVVNTIADTAQTGQEYADNLREQYEEEWAQVSQNIISILDSVSGNDSQAAEYRDNILQAIDEITASANMLIDRNISANNISQNAVQRAEELRQNASDLRDDVRQDASDLRNDVRQDASDLRDDLRDDASGLEDLRRSMPRQGNHSAHEPGTLLSGNGISENLVQISANIALTPEAQQAAQSMHDNFQIISDNLRKLQDEYGLSSEDEEEFRTNLKDELQNSSKAEDINGLIDIVEQGSREAGEGIGAAVSQINAALDAAGGEVDTLQEGNFIRDVSAVTTSPEAKGVISGCRNLGNVSGDINAGGIAGAMNVEYSDDPERDLSFVRDTNIIIRTTVNDVIMNCANLGMVSVKKNHAGGIVGGQSMGLVYHCEAYGYITAESGDELGGIVGYSEAAVRECYSLCTLEGRDRLGGICGYGSTMEDCIAICEVESDGECRGAIAGEAAAEGNRIGNFFAGGNLEGIDGISYSGIAERREYDDIMQMEGIPEDFHRVRVEFVADDVVLKECQIPYGGMILKEDYPEIPLKDGFYARWVDDEGILTGNRKVSAEYIPWIEALGSAEKDEFERTLFLIAGRFRDGDRLQLIPMTEPVPMMQHDTLLYEYGWTIETEEEQELPGWVVCHFATTDAAKAQLYIYQDGKWSPVNQADTDGSYLVATLSYGTPFAVVESSTTPAYRIALIIGGAVLLLVFTFYTVESRRKAARKKSEGNGTAKKK